MMAGACPHRAGGRGFTTFRAGPSSLDELVDAADRSAERFGTNHLQYQYEGSQYALPDRGGAMIVYYNLDMFDAAGVEYPTAEWTWEDFLAAAQALTLRDGDTVTQYGFAAGGWWPWWMSFIYQNGGAVLMKPALRPSTRRK
jgi:multiple sugar transport system substrate-binding protein